MKFDWKKLLDRFGIGTGENDEAEVAAEQETEAGTEAEAVPEKAEEEKPELPEEPYDPGFTDPREGMEVPWETGEQNWQKTLDARREKRHRVAKRIRKGWIPLTVLLVCSLFILAVSITYLVVRDQRLPEIPAAGQVPAETLPQEEALPEEAPEETPAVQTPPIKIEYVTSGPEPSAEPEPEEEPPEEPAEEPEQFLSDPEEQRLLNSFLTVFAEQAAFEADGYDGTSYDHQELVYFAYVYCRLHRIDAILGAKDGDTFYYTMPMDTVNEVLERFFHLTLWDKDMRTEKDPDAETRPSYSFYRNGYFYFPMQDVQALSRVAVAREKTQLDERLFMLTFDIWSAEGDPGTYSGVGPAEAEAEPALTKEASGTMTFRTYEKDGETRIYPVDYRVERVPDAGEE
jgi:hypothetical protein